MADGHDPQGQSLYDQRLPSFESLKTSLAYESSPNLHRSPLNPADDVDDNSFTLVQRLQMRDQTISALRHECGRRQTLYEQLETRSRLLDRQLADLQDERADLRSQTSALANQVDSLTQEREQLRHHAQLDAAQWRQIMAMSSQLQMKSVEETRRFNMDREAWILEKSRLEQRLIDYQNASSRESEFEDAGDTLTGLKRAHTISDMSDVQVRQELTQLQARYAEIEDLLHSIIEESASIERAGSILRMAKRRIGQGDTKYLYTNPDGEDTSTCN